MDISENLLKKMLNCYYCKHYEEYYSDQYGGLMNECHCHGHMGFLTEHVCDNFEHI